VGAETGSGIAHEGEGIVKKRGREALRASSTKLAEAQATCSPEAVSARAAQAAALALESRKAPGIQREVECEAAATRATGSL
jgi:hypothetical protein